MPNPPFGAESPKVWAKARTCPVHVAQNGCAEQSNPFGVLQNNGAGNQPQAQTGEMAQEANAFRKAGRYADVVKTERSTNCGVLKVP